jgi:hypothetical protein
MNVHMRIITDDNVDNLMSMSYSDNAKKILNAKTLQETEEKYIKYIHNKQRQHNNFYLLHNKDAEISNNIPSIQEPNTETNEEEIETNEEEIETKENISSSTTIPYAPYSSSNDNEVNQSIDDTFLPIDINDSIQNNDNNQPPVINYPSIDDTFFPIDVNEWTKNNDNANINTSPEKVSILDVPEEKMEPETDTNTNNDSSQIKKVSITEDL